ncbi:MAG: exodeoxyribonuclease VII large subunit [Lachnospiraceae bacterium]|nr:exodeoxyribonuclease VII large subunit [Lachnospiraceae bacterium]
MSVYTVAQINSYISHMFSEDYLLRGVTVRGEVSGCKYHSSGHIYFTLKDESGVIACMMYRQHAQALRFRIEDGRQILVTGQVRVYEKTGRYQLYAEKAAQDGQGALYEKFNALKERLAESGMFDACYKQPIPKYVRTLGVVTAPTGAAVRDIIHIARRRNPGIRIILYPAIVQGDQAADSIAAGIRALAAHDVDCMIVGRGGGSIEDLWAFNEERVAQAIFDCPVPVISAVGHETDFTIADFAADLRAPTPSAAAELAVYEAARLDEELADLETVLTDLMDGRLQELRESLREKRHALTLASPQNRLRERRTRLVRARENMCFLMERKLSEAKHRMGETAALHAGMEKLLFERRKRLDVAIGRLEGLSPVSRLKSGYAHVADDGGNTVRSVRGVERGDMLTVTMRDGQIEARAERITTAAAEDGTRKQNGRTGSGRV